MVSFTKFVSAITNVHPKTDYEDETVNYKLIQPCKQVQNATEFQFHSYRFIPAATSSPNMRALGHSKS